MKATKESRKTQPMPELRERLPFDALYTDSDAEKIMNGFIPKEMEDKWFIYFENGWLFFHRSWTGHCIYMVKLDGSPAGVRVVEAWVNRDKEQYNNSDRELDIKVLSSLIENKLIKNENYRA
jgi:hypothetical protein